MRNITIIQIIILLILEIKSQKTNSFNNIKKKSRNLDIKIYIPGYPQKPGSNNSGTGSGTSTDTTTSGKPNPTTGSATGTTFSQVAQSYYGITQNNASSNIYLEYPEPNNGWEEELCQNSVEQSPINIPYETDFSIIKDGSNVEILSIDYNYLQSGTVTYQQNHMWGLGILNGGNIRIRIEKNEYIFYLSEVYFHLLSEHRLQNKQYPFEMQLVHYNSNYQNNYEKLIISVLFDYSNNIENELLSELRIGSVQGIEFADFSAIVKKSKPFYYYKGGLTIPPCSNNVHWIIFKDIYNMTYTQFETIKNWIEGSNKFYYSTGYGNARGIKSLNGRKIYYESDFKTTTKVLPNGTVVKENNLAGALVYKYINITNLLMIMTILISLL